MTHEEILKKAFEVYPEALYYNDNEHLFPIDANSDKREGYIKALTELNLDAVRGEAMHEIADRYEALPKIKGWVARCDAIFRHGNLLLFGEKPQRDGNYGWKGDYICTLANYCFPDLKWKDEPIEVKLIIKKI